MIFTTNNKKGFTLIELIIVITILGFLTVLISGNFFTSLKKGRDARRKADLEQIQRALEMYYEDKKQYPPGTFVINATGYKLCERGFANNCGTEKVYMQKIPNDPQSGKLYEYKSDTSGSYYRLYACLENTQQVLPYDSLTGSPTIPCSTRCINNNGENVYCFWAVSSSNVNP